MERFRPLNCIAGILQPGDATRYIMAVVEEWDVYNVVVLNDCWVDRLIFLKNDLSFYKSERGSATNPWTIKAATEMLERFLKNDEATIIKHWKEEPLITIPKEEEE